MTTTAPPRVREVDHHQVLRILRSIVGMVGESFTYQQHFGDDPAMACVYVRNGAPCCLVGKVFSMLGVPLSRIEHRDLNSMGIGRVVFGAIEEISGIRFTATAREILVVVQNLQDRGQTWGVALEEAEFEYGRRAAGVA